MAKKAPKDSSRRMLDHLAGPRELGTPEALFATTFDLNRDFVEVDYLPTVLGISTWDDDSPKGRLELEQQLARVEIVALAMDGRRFQGRPRSLRVHLKPAVADGGGSLHAKVNLIVHEEAVRLLVGSANLTASGFRHNREAAIAVQAGPKRPIEVQFVRRALEPMRQLLAPWWTDQAEKVVSLAEERLASWTANVEQPQSDEFVWSGPGSPLWSRFLERWPGNEPIQELFIVSPFWSDETREGPLQRLLGGLRSRRVRLDGAKMKLIARAARDAQATYCPVFPSSFGEFDFRKLGLPVVAAAASPEVDKADVNRDDITFERHLHAKAVLLIGPKTALAYMGSANFTMPGWGFGTERASNVEAGVILLREGKAREGLRQLLPPTCKEILLDGPARGFVAVDRELEDCNERPFPSFLSSVELVPADTDQNVLELVISLHADGHSGAFSIGLDNGETRSLLLSVPANAKKLAYPVSVDADTVRELMRRRVVSVEWEDEGVQRLADFPLNVSMRARDSLPFADPAALPRESELIAYYQGKIALADLFPEVTAETAEQHTGVAAGSTVDTSDILSYRVRSFVEALPGIRRELSESTATRTTMCLAFHGPVSPVALAKEIIRRVPNRTSKTAAAFQLAELLACIRSAKPKEALSPRLTEGWREAVGRADSEISRLYDELKTASPELGTSAAFGLFERAVLPVGGAS